MKYTVGQLAALTGVSTRTLRYYDSIGLLSPAYSTEAGYRIYGEREVDQLQQILLYRALDLSLETIGRMVHEPGFDRLTALREQRARLETRRSELDLLIQTVDRTIENETGGTSMTAKEKFEGLKRTMLAENERQYGAELRENYSEDTLSASREKFASLSESEFQEMEGLGAEILRGLEQAVREGASPAGEIGLALAEKHRRWLGFSLPHYSAEVHKRLCEMYLADARFTRYYDKNVPGCAKFLRDAVHEWIK